MKKIFGVFIITLICILGLCSCAGPKTQAENQDLADRIAKVVDAGKEKDVNGKTVCLYSLTDNKISIGDSWFNINIYTNFTEIVQYNEYFEVYTKDNVYTFSNTVAGYVIY